MNVKVLLIGRVKCEKIVLGRILGICIKAKGDGVIFRQGIGGLGMLIKGRDGCLTPRTAKLI